MMGVRRSNDQQGRRHTLLYGSLDLLHHGARQADEVHRGQDDRRVRITQRQRTHEQLVVHRLRTAVAPKARKIDRPIQGRRDCRLCVPNGESHDPAHSLSMPCIPLARLLDTNVCAMPNGS